MLGASQLPAPAFQLPALAYLPLLVTTQRLLTLQLVTLLGHPYNWLTAATLMVSHYNT